MVQGARCSGLEMEIERSRDLLIIVQIIGPRAKPRGQGAGYIKVHDMGIKSRGEVHIGAYALDPRDLFWHPWMPKGI